MKITDILKKECIIIPPKGNTKVEIIQELANLIFLSHPEINKEESLKGIFERESVETTAIGEGIAIPHAAIDGSTSITLGFGIFQDGIDFDSLDGKPVKVILLILFPKGDIGLQLRFLAKLSRFAHNKELMQNLLECKNPDEVLHTFQMFEEKEFS
ncbi:MAG: PTS sugar transporter subunit IIA [Leptospiraceae bacterium]|nr:PTS sugar transporter subunit IIA [Leptospiraceae bacterium]MCP5495320.1 PTS sugar transporter subunit IIA [Leptospiraceae bacterium]